MITAIIAAAGKGERAKQNKNKVLSLLAGKPVIERTLTVFLKCKIIDKIILVINPSDEKEIDRILISLREKYKKAVVKVYGGNSRLESVKNALEITEDGFVLIHDGARPYVSEKLINECVKYAALYGNAVPVIPVPDTCATATDDNTLLYDLDRDYVKLIQSPECFKVSEIKKAYSFWTEDTKCTDDSGLYSEFIGKVHFIKGDTRNKKITYSSDFNSGVSFVTGIGFDIHVLKEGRKLILGGIVIPHDKGLLGHSDADVLVHSIMDAILSAAGLKDIGHYFPDDDPAYKDADSCELLASVLSTVRKIGYSVHNVSSVIMAEKPKLSPYIDKIIENLAKVIHISTDSLGISCTTMEQIGTVGREEGIAAQSSVLLYKDDFLA